MYTNIVSTFAAVVQPLPTFDKASRRRIQNFDSQSRCRARKAKRRRYPSLALNFTPDNAARPDLDNHDPSTSPEICPEIYTSNGAQDDQLGRVDQERLGVAFDLLELPNSPQCQGRSPGISQALDAQSYLLSMPGHSRQHQPSTPRHIQASSHPETTIHPFTMQSASTYNLCALPSPVTTPRPSNRPQVSQASFPPTSNSCEGILTPEGLFSNGTTSDCGGTSALPCLSTLSPTTSSDDPTFPVNETMGFNINEYHNSLPVYLAAAQGDIGLVHMLLKFGADPNEIDDISATALDAALTADSSAIVPLLVNSGARDDLALCSKRAATLRGLSIVYSPRLRKRPP